MRIEREDLRQSRNNLTFARLVLATCVIYSHCLWQTSGSDQDLFSRWLGAPISTFAVDGFFFVSGFLVYRSLCEKADLKRFAIARFARLWPGLAVMTLVVAAVGSAFSVDQVGDYVASTLYGFVGHNLTFIHPVYTLAGIYCGDVLCNVNGSLWTIPWEVRCYLILALLFVLGLSSPKRVAAIVFPLSALFAVAYSIPAVQSSMRELLPTFASYYFAEFDRLWSAFVLGMGAFLIHRHIPLKWSILVVLLAFNVLVEQMMPAASLHVRTIVAAYLVFVLGFLTVRTFGAFSAAWPDYSYGMYIYAFPVMIVLHFCGIQHLLPLILLNFVFTIIMAAGSWHLIEKPALDRLRRDGQRKGQLAQPVQHRA